MHAGLHAGGVECDTIHLNNITYAYYKYPVQVGLGRPGTDDRPQLDFWQQISRRMTTGSGTLSAPYTFGACTVQVLVDRNGDGTRQLGPPTNPANDGWWQNICAVVRSTRASSATRLSNCTYDPNDDGNLESDLFESGNPTYRIQPAPERRSALRAPAFPEFVWACVGDTQDPPTRRTLYQVQPSALCFAEVDANGDPIVREGNGPGALGQAKYDLYEFRGRQIWIRYLVTDVQAGVADNYRWFRRFLLGREQG